MSVANRILKITSYEALSPSQISKKLDVPITTVYGRISELTTRRLINKTSGKFIANESGKLYILKKIKRLEIPYHIKYGNNIEWNYKISKKFTCRCGRAEIIKTNYIYAETLPIACKLAQLIYGSETEVNYID